MVRRSTRFSFSEILETTPKFRRGLSVSAASQIYSKYSCRCFDGRFFAEMPVSQVGPLLAKQRSKDVCAVTNNDGMRPRLFQRADRVQVLEGDINGADGPASIFIDIIGRPFTPVSFDLRQEIWS
jgi:hypothetical protein